MGIKGVTIGIMGLETPKSGGFFLLSTSVGDTYLTIRQKGDDTDCSQQVGPDENVGMRSSSTDSTQG